MTDKEYTKPDRDKYKFSEKTAFPLSTYHHPLKALIHRHFKR